MEELYTNLPIKQKDELNNTIGKLTTGDYQNEYQFNVGEYDSAVAFFVKRGCATVKSTVYIYIYIIM